MKSKFFGNKLKYVREVIQSDMKSGTSESWNQRLESSFTQKEFLENQIRKTKLVIKDV